MDYEEEKSTSDDESVFLASPLEDRAKLAVEAVELQQKTSRTTCVKKADKDGTRNSKGNRGGGRLKDATSGNEPPADGDATEPPREAGGSETPGAQDAVPVSP